MDIEEKIRTISSRDQEIGALTLAIELKNELLKKNVLDNMRVIDVVHLIDTVLENIKEK